MFSLQNDKEFGRTTDLVHFAQGFAAMSGSPQHSQYLQSYLPEIVSGVICIYNYFLSYSGHPNKSACTFINFWIFFQHAWPY